MIAVSAPFLVLLRELFFFESELLGEGGVVLDLEYGATPLQEYEISPQPANN
ncbi:MAG: hypothetical protein O7I93_01905 [Gemmatimonadetes bacterium]|nr:hypothetical protein [Gemmatimonadota bacterium]